MNSQSSSYWDAQYSEGQDYPQLNNFLLRRMLESARMRGKLQGPRALDLGCGTGDLARQLAHLGFEVTAVDFSATSIEQAKNHEAAVKPIAYHVADIETFEPEGEYDLITMKLVLAFLKDKPAMLRRMNRMLSNPCGICILVAPILLHGETYNEHIRSISDNKFELERWLADTFATNQPYSEQYFGPNGIAAHYLLDNEPRRELNNPYSD